MSVNPKNYNETIEYLYRQLPMYQRQGSSAFKKDLDNIKQLCKWLDNPQKQLRCIHIAGTNGKGSVSHMLAAYLKSKGFKVGLYTSPHYKDFRERIKIDGALLSKRFVTRFVKAYIEEYLPNHPKQASFFELTVAMAFESFREANVDIAIIETGLGGRLDSTNIIHPLLSVITNISFDHQDMLGNTLKKIAAEKAGIIKRETPSLIGEYQEEVWSVFEKKAKSKGSKIYKTKDLIKLSQKGIMLIGEIKKTSFEIKWKNISAYQTKNLKTVLATIALLTKEWKEFNLSEKLVKINFPKLLQAWHFYGRMQVIQQNPTILLDSAHNEAGILEWSSYIRNQSFKKLHLVLGVVKDKDLNKILPLLPKDAKYYFVKANIPRAMSTDQLKKEASSRMLFGKEYSSVRQGLKAAKLSAKKNDMIAVLGSIFVLAEVV